jgi:hypothetical protein
VAGRGGERVSHPVDAGVIERLAEGLSSATCEAWVEQRLGERLWSKQREIAASVRENRYTAVPSCHGAGKSHLASRLLLHWLNAHPIGEAFVVTAAPTQAQIEGVVWRYVQQGHAAAGLPGRVTTGNVPMLRTSTGEMIAWGRKPADFADPTMAMQAFQGIHARYVLVILDEACGIPAWLWDATDTLVVNDHSRVVAIGNPDSPAARFEKVCRPGSGWNVIRIAAEDTPNFTGEEVSQEVAETLISKRWVGERERRWGRESALFTSKVLGRFPSVSDDTLIGADLIVAAQGRTLPEDEPRAVLACDVARLGGDRTVVYLNRCGRVRLLKEMPPQDTMRTTGDLVALKSDSGYAQRPLVLDIGGLGIGIYDRLVEQSVPVEGFSGAERAWRPDRFANRRAEVFWALRDAMMRGQIDLDPLDEELAAQLGALRWHRDSKGRIVIESKDEMRKRGLPSPDRADAVSMTFARSEWQPVLVPTPEDELARVLTAHREAVERRNSPEGRLREASGAPDLTADDIETMPL